MPGVYDEALYNPKGGTSWDTLVRIAAYDPSDRPILRPPAGASRVIMFASEDSSYIELDRLVLDAGRTRNMTRLKYHGARATVGRIISG